MLPGTLWGRGTKTATTVTSGCWEVAGSILRAKGLSFPSPKESLSPGNGSPHVYASYLVNGIGLRVSVSGLPAQMWFRIQWIRVRIQFRALLGPPSSHLVFFLCHVLVLSSLRCCTKAQQFHLYCGNTSSSWQCWSQHLTSTRPVTASTTLQEQ